MTLNVIKVLNVITFGPKFNKGLIICVIGFSPKYNGSLSSIHVCVITAPNVIKSLTEICDGLIRYSQLATHYLRPIVVFMDIH